MLGFLGTGGWFVRQRARRNARARALVRGGGRQEQDKQTTHELAAVGVGPGVGHRQVALALVLQLEVLVGELLAVDGLAACVDWFGLFFWGWFERASPAPAACPSSPTLFPLTQRDSL